jgi:multiple sugar transport system permease protein
MDVDVGVHRVVRLQVRGGVRFRRALAQTLVYLLLTLGAVAMVVPFVWMVSTSLKPYEESYTSDFFPSRVSFDAYVDAWASDRIQSMFPRWYVNSAIVCAIAVASSAFFNSLAGYAFSRYRFPGYGVMFILVLSTMMIPTEMLILPWYQFMVDLHWANTYQGLLWPMMMGGFGIFLMKQFIDGVPMDLMDAATVDGVSEFGIFLRIVFPLVKPALAALCILNFLGAWNDFLWPLIVTSRREMWTVSLGIGSFGGELAREYNLQMAAATIASIPIIIVFLLFQRQIIEGIALTGLRG